MSEEINLVCEERFGRDKERIEQLEENDRKTVETLAVAVQTLKKINEQIDDHNARIREVEKRPAGWFDRIIGAVLSAVVAAFVAWVMTGGIT